MQWKMDPWKMIFFLNMGIFHCYISLPEGIYYTLEVNQHFKDGKLSNLEDVANPNL